MCKRINCESCNKPSWEGCGAHVEQILGDVPVSERCSCESGSTSTPGLLARLFGAR